MAPSGKRGILCQAVRLTPRRLGALLAGHNLEVTLEGGMPSL